MGGEGEGAEDHVKVVAGLYCLTVPFCALPALVCLIGASVTLGQGLYTGEDLNTSSFVLVEPDGWEEGQFVGFTRFKLIEMEPKTWTLDLGEVSMGRMTLAEAKAAVSPTQGSIEAGGTAAEGDFHALDYAGKQYALCDPDIMNIHEIPALGPKLIFCVLGFLVIKVYKYFLLMVTVYPDYDKGVPTKLYELFFNLDKSPCLKKCFGCLWIAVDFVVLTWGPNVALLPLSSIYADEKYQNLAYMSMQPLVWAMASYGLATAVVCWVILVIADTYHEEEPWECSTNPISKLCLLIPRTMLLMVILTIIFVSLSMFSVNIKLAIGLDLGLIFTWSFRFGLVAWASLLRFFLFFTSVFELVMTVSISCLVKVEGSSSSD